MTYSAKPPPGVVASVDAAAVGALPAEIAVQAGGPVADYLDGDPLADPRRTDALADLDDFAGGLVAGRDCVRLGLFEVLVEVGATDSLGSDLDDRAAGARILAFDALDLEGFAVVERGEHVGHFGLLVACAEFWVTQKNVLGSRWAVRYSKLYSTWSTLAIVDCELRIVDLGCELIE